MFPLGQIVLVVSHMHICEAIIASLWMLFASCLAVRSLSKRKVFFPSRMEADSKLGRGPTCHPGLNCVCMLYAVGMGIAGDQLTPLFILFVPLMKHTVFTLIGQLFCFPISEGTTTLSQVYCVY